jgi:hypothetical protein
MCPEGSIWIGLGGTTKLTANITSVDPCQIYWQRVENNIARNIVLNTIKYSGSSCDVPVPELVINDVDTTDAGLYQINVTTITGSFIGPRVAVKVIGGKLFLALCVYFVNRCLSFYAFSFGHCVVCRASKRNFARRNNTALGPRDRLRLLSKLKI